MCKGTGCPKGSVDLGRGLRPSPSIHLAKSVGAGASDGESRVISIVEAILCCFSAAQGPSFRAHSSAVAWDKEHSGDSFREHIWYVHIRYSKFSSAYGEHAAYPFANTVL